MSKKDWQPFIDIVDNEKVIPFFDKIPKDYQLIYALALSVGKWHPTRKRYNLGSSINCGLCIYNARIDAACCAICPLEKIGENCLDHGSLFDKWFRDRTKENANKMFKVLYKLYTDEYNKLKKKGLV